MTSICLLPLRCEWLLGIRNLVECGLRGRIPREDDSHLCFHPSLIHASCPDRTRRSLQRRWSGICGRGDLLLIPSPVFDLIFSASHCTAGVFVSITSFFPSPLVRPPRHQKTKNPPFEVSILKHFVLSCSLSLSPPNRGNRLVPALGR